MMPQDIVATTVADELPLERRVTGWEWRESSVS
jgi:hypothetical protein